MSSRPRQLSAAPAAATLLLLLALAPAAARAQVASDATPAAGSAAPAGETDGGNRRLDTSEADSWEVRRDFAQLLRSSPSELATILVLDPTLLSNQAFLAGYPALAAFVAEHPQVRHNPRFYLDEFRPADTNGLNHLVEGLAIFGSFGLVLFVLAWLVRTVIEQRRWSRLSRTQSEVHNRILERFGTSEALLEYMRSPAGSKFLESAPIPLHAEQASPNAPLSRVLWSIQVGLVVAAGALGMILVSGRFEADDARGLFAFGVVALCVGGGFVLSALTSLFLSRRLGLWQGAPSSPADAVEDAGFGR